MPESECDRHLDGLAEFIDGKFTKREIRDMTKSSDELETAAVQIFGFYATDPVFVERMEPLVNCGSGDRWRLSAVRESLKRLRRRYDPVRLARSEVSAVSGEQNGVNA